jgi:hypothetical protein
LASTTANPDRTAASVAHSGLATHPVVAANAPAELPGTFKIELRECIELSTKTPRGTRLIKFFTPADCRALAAGLIRAAADYEAALADEVEAAGTDNTTRSPDA